MACAYRLFIFMIAAALGLYQDARAAESPFPSMNPEPPRITTSHDFPSSPVRPGDVIRGVIVVDIPEGWHVYAPGAEKYRKLEVINGDGPVDEPRFEYPRGHAMDVAGEQAPVYDGRVEIAVEGVVSPGAEDGVNYWRPVVSWQSCSDRLCLTPESRTLNIAINVKSEG